MKTIKTLIPQFEKVFFHLAKWWLKIFLKTSLNVNYEMKVLDNYSQFLAMPLMFPFLLFCSRFMWPGPWYEGWEHCWFPDHCFLICYGRGTTWGKTEWQQKLDTLWPACVSHMLICRPWRLKCVFWLFEVKFSGKTSHDWLEKRLEARADWKRSWEGGECG